MITMIAERLLKGHLKPSVTDAEDILRIIVITIITERVFMVIFFVMPEWQIFFLALRFNRFNLNNVFPANATESL